MMRLDQDDDLRRLDGLIRTRDANAVEITQVIGRPVQLAHNRRMHCELDIRYALEQSAVHPGSDGRFRSGALAGRSINIKMYGKGGIRVAE